MIKSNVLKGIAISFAILVSFSGCAPRQAAESVVKEEFGTLATGQVVDIYTMTSSTGIEMRVMTYGATITSLKVPDPAGEKVNVTLGFDNLAAYEAGTPYFGAIIGRFGNRIAGGQFTLDGVNYELATNDGANHLHGGNIGFDKVVWEVVEANPGENPSLMLRYISPDGEEGYPGTLTVTVTYTLIGNDLRIDYLAETEAPTIINLTNHAYFNLAGRGNILDHILTINAKEFTPVDATLIPTGEILPVSGTPFDFTTPFAIGARIDQVPGGYDHNFVLAREKSDTLMLAAKLKDPVSGRTMEIFTLEPGIQFYAGGFLDGTLSSGDWVFERFGGLCLETQHFPDSPNNPHFPSTVLRPGEIYQTTTIKRFGSE
ncbi:MAG TPA: aldose epimerase family protein [Bacteroidales bacterium]|nr:aldose epimerase family protein [Bacteroidales bacterium]